MRTFKKSLITAAVLTLAVVLLCACSGRSNPFSRGTETDEPYGTGTDTQPYASPTNWTVPRGECTHAFAPYASAAATCTADGYEISRCTLCGETVVTVTAAQGHLFAADTPTDLGTGYHCTRAGCSACYTETGAAVQSAPAYALPLDGTDAFVYDPDAGETPASDTCVLLPYGNATWGYQSLASAAQRRFYAAAMQTLLSFAATSGDLPGEGTDAVCLLIDYASYGLNEEQARTVLNYLSDDSPSLFWLDDTFVCKDGMIAAYVRDAWRDPAQRTADAVRLETLVQTICGDDGVVKNQMEGAADFDLAVAAYRAVKKSLSLSDTAGGVADTAAGVLTGQCTPLGYARLLSIVCNRLGIPCITVRGTAEGDGRNVLQLGGDWYAADAAADDADDADWLRSFGTTALSDVSPVSYPLPALAAVAVCPATLADQNGVVGRFISVTAAFAAMTDANGRYVVTPDADAADAASADPFAWSVVLPADNWPRVDSLTIAGAVVYNDVLGAIAMPLQVSGNPVLYSSVYFRDVVPESKGIFILVDASVTFSGENAMLSIAIGGDESTAVIFNYSGQFTYAGRCQVGTVTFAGTVPVVEGIVSCKSLLVSRRTTLELRGGYDVSAQKLTLSENSTLVLTDRIAGKGTLTVGAISQNTDVMNVKVRILDADDYPTVTFEERVTVPTVYAVEGTALLPSAIDPDTFDGILYTLSGGTPADWTLTVAGVDLTGRTLRDVVGHYRFAAD